MSLQEQYNELMVQLSMRYSQSEIQAMCDMARIYKSQEETTITIKTIYTDGN